MRSRGDRLRCLPCVAHGARPAPALAALVCSPAPLAHQGARPPASLGGWPGAAGNRAAPPGGPRPPFRCAGRAGWRFRIAGFSPPPPARTIRVPVQRQRTRSQRPRVTGCRLSPPGVPASTCCIGATECPDLGGSNHGAEDSDRAPDRRLFGNQPHQQARHHIPLAPRSVIAGFLPAKRGLHAHHHGSSSIAVGTGHRPDSHATRWRTSSVRCTRLGTVARSAGNSHAT